LEYERKKCIQSYEGRKAILESLVFVDLVVPENNWEQKIDDVKRFNIDVFVLGND